MSTVARGRSRRGQVIQPVPLLSDFGLGMRQDIPRDQMPNGSCWNLVDYIPRILGAGLRKRGGWPWGSPLTGGGGYATNVFYAPFRAGTKLLKVNSDGAWYNVTSDTAETLLTGTYSASNPFWFHRDRAITGMYGFAPCYWAGGAVNAIIAAAPLASYGVTYKDRSVMGNGKVGATDYPQRIWFSAAGDPLTWDLTNSWVDASFPIRGLASLRNMILVFGDGQTERILGATPPTALDLGDMERGSAFNVGCIDARSIVPYGELVIFANGEGIWRTDGSVPENLTRGGSIRRYWLDLMATWQTGWTLAAGVIADNYIISVTDQSGVFKDCLMLDLGTLSWVRHANIAASMFASNIGAAEELAFASRTVPRLGRLSPIFRPSSALGADADGTVILPVLETPYVGGAAAFLRWQDLYMNYLLDGSGVGTSPTFDVGLILEPEDTTYTSIGALGGQATMRRDTLPIRFDSPGVAFKITQQLASGDTRIHGMEASVYPLEGSRVR